MTTAAAKEAAAPADRYIDLDEIASTIGCGKSTLERWKAAGQLPPHYELSPGLHRWKLSEVLAWIESRRAKVG